MKYKILYNFLNEHNDINDFLFNCMNLTRLRMDLNYLENSSFHQNERKFFSFLKEIYYPNYTPVLVLIILMGIFTLIIIFRMILNDYKFQIENKRKQKMLTDTIILEELNRKLKSDERENNIDEI